MQCYLSCTERNHQRVLNEHTSGDPRWCWPQWPDLPAGASLTIDPSMPPPTTAQTPFCDWPAGKQVPSYPEGCRNMVPTQPRLSNAGSMHARVRARQAARRQSNPPRFSSTTREIVQLMRRVR
ncbi:MAG: hypothetical protein Q8Q14_10700 [Gemmatimonadales bacterium]|nr:hypothetical protein [Gemmatimonadales bacterium]